MTSRPFAGWGLAALCVALAGCAAAAQGAQQAAAQPAASAATTTPAAPAAPKAKATPKAQPPGLDPAANPDPFPSTYQPLPSEAVAYTRATILTATGRQIDNGTIILSGGRILAVGGPETPIPDGVRRVDAAGQWITPGLIDIHSHLGVFASPGVQAHSDGNEATDPNTSEVWAEHSVWPQDPGFNRAREGGVTSLLVLPGSANLFGGRSVTLRNVPSVTMQGMKFPGAPYGLKMACGENPKRVYGSRQRAPSTRMGNVAQARRAWIDAAEYSRRWADWRAKLAAGESAGDPPKRDLRLETLAGVLAGEILVQNHCYRADEMALMIDMAREFGYRITTFHHASEAYKLAPRLRELGICSATWADWQSFKLESLDGIAENAGILQASGACTIIHSDDSTIIQHLNQEAAIAMGAAARMGLPVSRAVAISWITSNPARAMGIADRVGTLEAGKMADVVVWDRDPFSVYARAQRVHIDGAIVFDRADPRTRARSDFELNRPSPDFGREQQP